MKRPPINDDLTWGIIPARGGSKSLPLKNLHPLNGHPLIDYVIACGKNSPAVSRLICSTDDQRIADHCEHRKVEVHKRPSALAQDNSHILDVLQHMLTDIGDREGEVAGRIVLFQPTSPFAMPAHVDNLLTAMNRNPHADSGQTIANVSSIMPNAHAFNQRHINEDGLVSFHFKQERQAFYNKQLKPTFYLLGNLLITKTSTYFNKQCVFGDTSAWIETQRFESMDVDGPDDFKIAELLLQANMVTSPLEN